MGALCRKRDGFRYTLAPRTRVGRSRDNQLVCEESCVSSSHCVLEWVSPGHWRARDLGSTNGTLVSGRRLHGQSVELVPGDELVFASAAQTWVFCDDSPPSAEAVNMTTGERRVAEAGMLLISDQPASWLELVQVEGSWLAEHGTRSEPVRDGQVILSAGQPWLLRLPTTASQTVQGDAAPSVLTPRELHLRFEVSQDLEHVRVAVTARGSHWVSDRAHHRVLLELARARLAEATTGTLDPSECGWLYADELCDAVGLDSESHLNVEVHRARREMAAHGVESPATIVERRRGTGKLRIGTSNLSVVEVTRSVRLASAG